MKFLKFGGYEECLTILMEQCSGARSHSHAHLYLFHLKEIQKINTEKINNPKIWMVKWLTSNLIFWSYIFTVHLSAVKYVPNDLLR